MTWTRARLKDVAQIDRIPISPESIGQKTIYLGLENIESGGEISQKNLVSNGEISSTKFKFTNQHLLYGKLRPYLAKIAIPTFSGICSTDILPIKPDENLDRLYLAFFLRQSKMVEYASARATGANLPRLSPKALEEFEIPLPPLDEQKRIAAILDQADDLRRLRRSAIDRLNTLGQSIFYEMFGKCDSTKLELAKIVDIKSSLVKPLEAGYENALHVGPEHIAKGSGYINWGRVKTAEEDAVISGKYIFDEKSILYSKIRPYLNKVALPDRPGVCSADMYALVPKKNLATREFIKYALMERDFLSYTESCSGRANIPKINRKQLLSYIIRVPKFDQMIEFSKAIHIVDSEIKSLQKALKYHSMLFQSLQQRAFRGDL